jgi:hypothetical protein
MYPFYNLAASTFYAVGCDGQPMCKEVLDLDVATYVSKPLPKINTTTFAIAYDLVAPGMIFELPSIPVCIADLLNMWNGSAVRYGNHSFSMEIDLNDPEKIVITNLGAYKVHLWTGIYNYHGSWEPNTSLRIPLDDFLDGSKVKTGPIIVNQNTHIADVTVYLYRRNTDAFYTRAESVIVPAGFYSSVESLVAILNSGITLRGERNGFIYQFITHYKKGLVYIGIEASHRQPDPSVLHFTPTSFASAFGVEDPFELLLRTNKKHIFSCSIHSMVV